MRIAFGAALPVGVGGARECFDLLLERYVSPERALEALQAASAPDLMAKSCAYLEPTAPAASVAFPVSTYRAWLWCSPLELPVPRSLEVVRKKKRKTLVVDDFLVGEMELAGAVVTFTLGGEAHGVPAPRRAALGVHGRLQRGSSMRATPKGSRWLRKPRPRSWKPRPAKSANG